MSDLLEQLESNEAILLMYLSGELSEQDHADVVKMLAADSALRVQLERLEQAQQTCVAALERLDRMAPMRDEAAVARRVMRAVRRQQLEREAAPAPPAEEPDRGRRAWWSYGMGSAAAAALLLLVWWTYQEPTPHMPGTGQPFAFRDGRVEMYWERVEGYLSVADQPTENLHVADSHRRALESRRIEEPFFFAVAEEGFDVNEEF